MRVREYFDRLSTGKWRVEVTDEGINVLKCNKMGKFSLMYVRE